MRRQAQETFKNILQERETTSLKHAEQRYNKTPQELVDKDKMLSVE